MTVARRIQRLVEEVLESGRSPDEVCRGCPELVPEVRERLRRARALESELDALFPTPRGDGAGAARTPPVEPPRIPGYDVHGVLGHGGMGVVYAARHLGLDRPVAIKMLLAGAYAAPAEVRRFRREAEAVARLRHQNVVQIYDVGELEGRPYFTMELVEGGSLGQKLAGTPLPSREAAALLATLAGAVQAAHEAGIVHRDLKPANVLLDAGGTPKVSDFGLARRIDGDPGLTLTGVRMGTPSYMAPEQALGKPEALGPAVDVYALGAILYEALTGRPPFRAETASETERQVIAEEPVPPSRLNAKVARDLETICLKCLRKEPERRYASAAELLDDLQRFQRGVPIAARPVGRAERLARWIRRNPTGAALIATALVLVGLAAGFGAREWAHAARTRAEAEKWTERQEFVHRLQEQGRFADARAILGRLPDGGSAEMRARIERAQGELDVLERLDAIRVARGHSSRLNRFDPEADRAYEQAFAQAGLGTLDEPPDRVAERIAATHVRVSLVAALDDWAHCVRDFDRLSRLLAIARLADPDPWRDQVRDPALWEDPAHLAALARDAVPGEQPVPLLLVVAGLLGEGGADSAGFLRRVQFAHPEDFWANFALAEELGASDAAEAIGFYRAALSARPRALAPCVNLGILLAGQGRLDEAMEYWRRAREIDPSSPVASLNMAIGCLNGGLLDEAREHAAETLRLDPRNARAHGVMGTALLRQARFTEAAGPLRAALELMPADDAYRASLADTLGEAEQMRALEQRLPAVLQGLDQPADGAERLGFASLTYRLQRYAASAGFYAAALDADPALAADLAAGHRYNAACSAALAGAGRGADGADVAAEARAAWRAQARGWLRADLLSWSAVLEGGGAEGRALVRESLAYWQGDADLAGLREGEALTEDERQECAALWDEVGALLARAQGGG